MKTKVFKILFGASILMAGVFSFSLSEEAKAQEDHYYYADMDTLTCPFAGADCYKLDPVILRQ